MTPDSPEALLSIATKTQFVAWDVLRLMDESSTEYRTAVNELAIRLLGLSERVAAQPSVAPDEAVEAEEAGAGSEVDDPYDLLTPGSMEGFAAVPEHFNTMTATLKLLVQ